MPWPSCASPPVSCWCWCSPGFPAPRPIRSPWACRSACLGLFLRAWAAGCLAKNQQLATGGPYAYTRNPLYLGTLLVAAGLVIASRNIGLGILFIAVFLLVYLPVIQLEEQHLRSLFPDYAPYAGQVPALWPRLTPAPTKNPNPFQTAFYLRNQEYQAGAGYVAGMLFLLWRVLG